MDTLNSSFLSSPALCFGARPAVVALVVRSDPRLSCLPAAQNLSQEEGKTIVRLLP
jgi:hypothetical protein